MTNIVDEITTHIISLKNIYEYTKASTIAIHIFSVTLKY